jgi:hypothetical protein
MQLTDEQKSQIVGILSVGCDRQTAVDFVGCSLRDLHRAMERDSEFASNIRRNEAGAELSHMRNVQTAAKDAKNWRASVWWLERRSPERYGPRGAGAVTARQLKAFIGMVVDILAVEVRDPADRQRLCARLQRLVAEFEQKLGDFQASQADSRECDASPPLERDLLGIPETEDSSESSSNFTG